MHPYSRYENSQYAQPCEQYFFFFGVGGGVVKKMMVGSDEK